LDITGTGAFTGREWFVALETRSVVGVRIILVNKNHVAQQAFLLLCHVVLGV
jgi:hypothetical protein